MGADSSALFTRGDGRRKERRSHPWRWVLQPWVGSYSSRRSQRSKITALSAVMYGPTRTASHGNGFLKRYVLAVVCFFAPRSKSTPHLTH